MHVISYTDPYPTKPLSDIVPGSLFRFPGAPPHVHTTFYMRLSETSHRSINDKFIKQTSVDGDILCVDTRTGGLCMRASTERVIEVQAALSDKV